MIVPSLRRLVDRAIPLGIAVVLLSALPGVAVASLPAHPAPTHACCLGSAPMPPAGCDSSPCCIEKPAPRSFSVLTGDALPVVLAASEVASFEPALAERTLGRPAPVPHARSAPLFVLLVTFLN